MGEHSAVRYVGRLSVHVQGPSARQASGRDANIMDARQGPGPSLAWVVHRHGHGCPGLQAPCSKDVRSRPTSHTARIVSAAQPRPVTMASQSLSMRPPEAPSHTATTSAKPAPPWWGQEGRRGGGGGGVCRSDLCSGAQKLCGQNASAGSGGPWMLTYCGSLSTHHRARAGAES